MVHIDRTSPVPIYHQLKTFIREQIESGLWRPGDRIPTEQELCHTYGISRSPVRQALKELVHEGLLVRRPGAGTFVRAPQLSPSGVAPIRMMCSDAHWSEVLNYAGRLWNEEHPERTIGFEVEVVSHARFYDLLSAAVGSGTAPDVAMVDCVWVPGLAQAGFLYPLEDLGSPWNHASFGRDLYPAFVAANSFNGRLYGLPVKADASLLWYRRDWFVREGLEPPGDWDRLAEAARHFTRPEVQRRYGLAYPLAFPGGVAGGEATVYTLMPFIWSAGGTVFDDGCVVLDSPATRRALRFLRELVVVHRAAPPEVVSYREDTALRLFASGKVAMALGGSYEGQTLREIGGWGGASFTESVGCVAPPAAPGGKPVSTVGGTSYVILRQSQRPALVMDVLRMAVDPGAIGELYRTMLQSLPNPSFNAVIAADTEPLLAQVSRMIASGRARPAIPEYFKVSRQLQGMFEAVISTDIPVEEIARRTAEFIGAISERPCRLTG